MKPTITDSNNNTTSENSLIDFISSAFLTQSSLGERKKSFSNLRDPKYFTLKSNGVAIEPYALSALLNNATFSPLLIDMRPLDLYEHSRIRHSIHMNVPTLLIKRYRRGVISNVNLESFISTSEGIAIYRAWLQQFQASDIHQLPNHAQFVLYDEQMMDPSSSVWVLLNAIQKNTDATVSYLQFGYDGFHQWDFTHKHIDTAPINKKEGELRTTSPMVSKSATMIKPQKQKGDGLQRRASLFSLDTTSLASKNRTRVAQQHSEDSFSPSITKIPPLPSLGEVTPKTEHEYDFVVSEIIPHFLYLGPEIVTGNQLIGLTSHSIKRILNMAEECDDDVPGLKERFRYEKIAARDTVEMQNVQGTLKKAAHVIEDAKKSHEPIYVHCKAGKSRSAAAILAYLVTSERWTLKKAYQHIVKARPNISPNIGFVAELMKMEQAVHGQVSNFAGNDWTHHPPSPDTQKEIHRLEKAWKRENRS